MTAVNFPSSARGALTTLKPFRNGRYPDALYHSYVAEEANRVAFYCVKSWSFASPIASVPSAGGVSTTRWRAFIHTSTHCRYAWVRFLTMPSNNTGTPVSVAQFTPAGSGVPSAECSFYPGAQTDSDLVSTITPGQARTIYGGAFVDLDADTDYEIQIVDQDNCRTLAVSVFEIGLQRDTDNGYIENTFVGGQEILDTHRSSLIGLTRDIWLRNGAPLITYSSSTDATAYANTGTRNILDASTTVTTSTPGFTIDCRYRSTLRRASSGVPCIMRAYLKTAATTGAALLKDSSGATLATCTTSSATAAWVSSGAFYLPATTAKYDLYGSTVAGLGNTTVYAVSVYQLE